MPQYDSALMVRGGFRGALNWIHMMLRDAISSDSYTRMIAVGFPDWELANLLTDSTWESMDGKFLDLIPCVSLF